MDLQEVAVKKFLDQDFSGAALAEFKREVSGAITSTDKHTPRCLTFSLPCKLVKDDSKMQKKLHVY